jgi:hypothetical protein
MYVSSVKSFSDHNDGGQDFKIPVIFLQSHVIQLSGGLAFKTCTAEHCCACVAADGSLESPHL